MEPRLLKIWGDPPDGELLAVVGRHLTRGGLVAMPTETVYGFGGILRDKPLKALQKMKGRGGDKPFLVLVPDAASVADLDWTPLARELAKIFWPGALTLVLRDPERRFPLGVRSPEDTVAVRQSPHPVARGLVETLGEPIVSTSANSPGGIAALSPEEAFETARSLGAGRKMWVLDAGILRPSEPSTIVDCTGDEPVVIRAGSIPMNRLRCVIPDLKPPA